MTNQGWWTLTTTIEPDDGGREHIANLIRDGYNQGEILNHDDEPQDRECEDCGKLTAEKDGRWYKYEPGIWLCDECHDTRMDDDQ